MKLSGFCLILLFASVTRAEAQSDSVITSILLGSTEGDAQAESNVLRERTPVRAIRLSSSTGGFVFGILLGGFAGSQLLYQDCTNCKKPEMDALMVGGAIGGAIGAGLGAAFLDLSSVCTFDRRLIRSLIGAGIGGAAFFGAGGGLHRGGRSVFLVPTGAGSGSLGALGPCWKSRH